jgi:ATP-dependent protease ClpP protease subunit
MARLCNQPLEKVQRDMKRDFYLTAPEATAYGLIDEVKFPEHVSPPSL